MIDNKFQIKKLLGQGGSSKVFLAEDELDRQFAIKILRKDKKYSYERGSRMIQKEHWIMSKLSKHPNILNSVYSNPDGIMKNSNKNENVMYNIIELAENGPVSSFIRVTGSIEEELVRFMFLQLSDAVRYIHNKRFAHLDLKLENILLDKYFNIKLADLGVAHQLTDNSNDWCHRRGTIHYMAPEVASLKKQENYDAQKADIYSLGVWLYILLIGEFPDHKLLNKFSESTNESEAEDPLDYKNHKDDDSTKNKWNNLSESARNLIIHMLSIEPCYRPSIEDVINHPWFFEPFTDETQRSLYSEMVYRKKFIANFSRKKTTSS